MRRCCIVAVRSLVCCGCLCHVALCVCVLTSSYDVMVVGVRSSRCFVILFPFCVRSFFWFVLCAVCLCGESVRLCVLFFVCGRGCSLISHHHHHHHHHQHHDHLTRASNPWRSKGLVDFARYDCFCLVSVHLHRKKTGSPPEVGCCDAWNAERSNRCTDKRLEAV